MRQRNGMVRLTSPFSMMRKFFVPQRGERRGEGCCFGFESLEDRTTPALALLQTGTVLSLTEVSNDAVLARVIETIVKESGVLARLPFIEMAGNALTYNREFVVETARNMMSKITPHVAAPAL